MPKFIIRPTAADFSLREKEELECFLLPADLPDSFIAGFARRAAAAGKIVLAEGEGALACCRKHHLDGIVADLSAEEDPGRAAAALRRETKDLVLGLISRNRRHEAMLLSEAEPDFLIFRVWSDDTAANRELIAWYGSLFLIQSAVMPQTFSAEVLSYPADIFIINDTDYTILVAKNKSLD